MVSAVSSQSGPSGRGHRLRVIATAASIWRPLAPTQDLLATDGLQFLQDWLREW